MPPLVVGVVFLLSGCSGARSILDPAGPSATGAAALWWGMFISAMLVLLLVTVLALRGIRRDPGTISDRDAQRIQNRWVVGGGVLLPVLSIAALLSFGVPIGHRMLPLLKGSEVLQIDVKAHQWRWEVRYPGTAVQLVDELRIPAGRPVHVHLTSADVIHSFWVPRLGGKLDAIPGHTNVLLLQADEPGSYHGQCAEFCGLNHAHMHFTVIAEEAAAFDRWLEEATAND